MSSGLDDYRGKRDFARTPEPQPAGATPTDGRPRFVIQRHDARALHHDLRLEHDGVLASWAVPKCVPLRHGTRRLAVRTEDHPLEYIDFAGDIPAGQYGAGRMDVWDGGTYERLRFDDDEIKVVLAGRRFRGEYHLVRTGERDGRMEWLVFRAAAAPPGPEPPQARFRAMRPMLATPADEPFDDPGWTFELKWDGYRALVLVGPEGTEIRSRSGRDMSARFAALGDLRRAFLPQEVVVDGEICALDADGRAVFQDIQTGAAAPTLVVFDLLYADGVWLEDRPLEDRRRELRAALAPHAAGRVMLSDDVPGTGRSLFAAVRERGAEGIVAKRLGSRYAGGARSHDWRKIKIRQETECVVCGYVPGSGARRGTFGALVLAERGPDGALRYVGRVGTGWTDAVARDLRRRLDRLVVDEPPTAVPAAESRDAVWVAPRLAGRVAFVERTTDGRLRAPSWLGTAEHEPEAIPAPLLDRGGDELRVRDGDREIRLTNLGKAFWSAEGITKGDILDHYARVAPVLVPHLAGRPMVLKRYPNGWAEPFFFQHALPDNAPAWLRRVTLRKGGDEITYAVVDDPLGLLWVVNLGCIDLNPWHSRADEPDLADYVLFDLDPQEGVPFTAVCEAALLIRDALDGLGLRGVPKTSGSRGIHILVPIRPVPHEAARLFAGVVAHRLVARRPDLLTVETAIARRGRRVYVDANQNGRGKTIASVYSVRPVPGATVSTPLGWEEVGPDLDPGAFTIGAVADRIQRRGDLFAGVLERDQDLATATGRLDA